MEELDVLIVGQGLAGTWLSWWLHQAGIHFKIIDELNPNGASMKAAGLINPVTGRRIVKTWMIDELMPFAVTAYQEIGKYLNESLIDPTTVIDFFPSVQMLQSFQKRFSEDSNYLGQGNNPEQYAHWLHYEFGWGSIQPCLLVKVEQLLRSWREWLKKKDLIIESQFDQNMLQTDSYGIRYADIHARYIVFCDGISSVQNPYFEKLPFAPNKGEGMLVEIKNLPQDSVYKKGMSLIPYKENIFWLGSSYEWIFEDDLPSAKFRSNAEFWLKSFLKLPYILLEHFAAIRPATLERRPFAGFHPLYPQIGILNGFGTKGCSLAPYFAKQLADKISGTGNIDPLADINRFKKILSNKL
jgi:glycine/D-amino acid oxidase-like deaminating enzyme